MQSNVPKLNVKLSPKLFDLFQHCELRCNAGCCGWDAFDLTDHWLSRWCDFRDASTISAARSDIASLRGLLDGYDLDSKIDIEGFFASTVATLTEHLDLIANALAAHANPDDNLQA